MVLAIFFIGVVSGGTTVQALWLSDFLLWLVVSLAYSSYPAYRNGNDPLETQAFR
jgi:hypothetical protein